MLAYLIFHVLAGTLSRRGHPGLIFNKCSGYPAVLGIGRVVRMKVEPFGGGK